MKRKENTLCTSLKEALLTLPKDLLAEIVFHLDLELPTSLSKKEYAERLETTMLSDPSVWLKKLSPYEIDLFKELAESPAGTRIIRPTLYFPLPSMMIQTLQVDDDESIGEEFIAYYLTDDVHAAVSDCIFELFESDLMKEFLELQQYGYGLLTLYGIVPIEKFGDEMECFPFSSEENYKELASLLGKSYLMLLHSSLLDGLVDEPVLVSPWVENDKKLWKEIMKRKDIPYKDFDYGEIMDAGMLPHPLFESDYTDAMYDLLENGEEGDDYDYIEQTLTDIWYCIQEGDSPSDGLQALLNGLPLEYRELTNDIVKTYTDFQNSLPRWDLKGHSPAEVYAMNSSSGSNDLRPTGNIVSMNGTPYVNANPKVGRNDPCPCGSGKKYKNCCGRN